MLNADEVWVSVAEFPGRYMVSNLGRVMSVRTNHGKPQEKLLRSAASGTSAYMYVKFSLLGKTVNRAVHKLVALAFVANPSRKPEVNHKDGNKHNNCAANLEWVTRSENVAHAYAIGARTPDKLCARLLGLKQGNSSKYHNVTYDASRNRWRAACKNGGKTLFQKRFVSETDAAAYVNKMLDELGLHDRPRNIIC